MSTLKCEDILTYDTEALIQFLKCNTKIKEDQLNILREQEVTGEAFLATTAEMYRSFGIKGGPAAILVKFAKSCAEVSTGVSTEGKKRAFSSFKTLEDLRSVLKRFGIDSDSSSDIPQFEPPTYSLADEDTEVLACITDVKRKLRNMETLVFDSNEAIRNEYISAILHSALHIVRKITNKKIKMIPQLDVSGEENNGRVDYAIKSLEELICITESKQFSINVGFVQNVIQCESALQTNKKKRKARDISCEYLYGIVTTATNWYFLLYSSNNDSDDRSDVIECTSKSPISIEFSEKSLEDGSAEDIELCKKIKQILEIIVGLLKDRLELNKSFKKQKKN